MIILDTDVISEVMRGPRADARVVDWVRTRPRLPVTTVINRAEIMAGIALLPQGRRRSRLEEVATSAFGGIGICLPLVPECAAHYADIVATRQAGGAPMGAMDALIAAIAREADATIATRNTADFDGLGLQIIDPWQGGAEPARGSGR